VPLPAWPTFSERFAYARCVHLLQKTFHLPKYCAPLPRLFPGAEGMSLAAIRLRLDRVKECLAARRSIYMRPRALNRLLWTAVTFLGVIAVAVIFRRAGALLPVFAHGYHPSPPPANPALAQFAGLDDIFASHVVLTMIHIVPGLLFVTLGPLQFNATLRASHLRWHRVSGRVYLAAAYIIGVSALIMSFAMPAIGGLNQAAATTFF
jgi:Predicted membrane protein (DUF2306)